MGNKKAKPSDADRAAAQRLRAEWDARARRLGLTQDKMAAKMGGTQGLVSQYLNGLIPLNYRALMHFAEALEIDPLLIRDDLREQAFTPTEPSRGSHAERPDPKTMAIAARALLIVLRRRDPSATLDLTSLEDAGLLADAYAAAAALDDEVELGATVSDLLQAREARRGKASEQAGGGDRGEAGGASSGAAAGVAGRAAAGGGKR